MTPARRSFKAIGECAKFLSGGTPSKSRPEFWEGDIPWVSSGEMTNRHIRDTPLHITEEGARKGSRLVPENTVLVVVRGMSLAKEFRISLTGRELAFNQDLKALVAEPFIDPRFLFYALLAKRDSIRDLATEASHGTKRLETDLLSAFQIQVPGSLEEQHKISDVLCAYDELIENNRRRIALLEDSARQLYEEWFVRLRFPGHEHTSITDGVPENWQSGSVSDFYQTSSGGTPSRKIPEYFHGDIPWVKTQELSNGFIIGTDESISQEGLQRSSAKVFPAEQY